MGKPFLYGAGFGHGGIIMLKQEKGQTQTVDPKLEAHYYLNYHCIVLRFLFIETEGSGPNQEKQTQTKRIVHYLDSSVHILLAI